MNKRILLSLFLLSLATLGFAQEELSCAEKLSEAQRRFEQGRFYGIPKLLEGCVKRDLNDQQRIDAYFLLSQTYLFIDEPKLAEEAYLSILKIDPEFEPDEERAPIDQVYLSEKFTTRPIFVLNGRLGANYTTVDVIQEFQTSATPLESDSEYNLVVGFEGSVGLDVVFTDFLSVGTEIGLVQKKYKFKQTMFNNDPQSMTESQWNVEVPLLARLRWKTKNLTPYVYGGVALNYTIGATADLSLIDRRIEINGEETEGPANDQFKILDVRERFTQAAILGGGLRIRSGYNHISIDLRYRIGFSNIVNEDTQFDNQQAVFRYAFVDDYKRLNNLVLSIGYVKPFYKPRKKKKYR